MLTDCSIISNGILNQSIAVVARALGKALILLGEIYTVTLNPGRNPGLVLSLGLAVREVYIIMKTMVLALDAYHTQQVNISRSCTYEAVNQCIALQHIVN